jgi:hypothetical protein
MYRLSPREQLQMLGSFPAVSAFSAFWGILGEYTVPLPPNILWQALACIQVVLLVKCGHFFSHFSFKKLFCP